MKPSLEKFLFPVWLVSAVMTIYQISSIRLNPVVTATTLNDLNYIIRAATVTARNHSSTVAFNWSSLLFARSSPIMRMHIFSDDVFVITAHSYMANSRWNVFIVAYISEDFNDTLLCETDNTSAASAVVRQGISNPKWEATWVATYLFCSIQAAITPEFITISAASSDGRQRVNKLPVEKPYAPQKRGSFGICVKSSYGLPHPVRIIEWMELNRLLGIDHVVIYDHDIKGPATKVLDFYARQGYATIVNNAVKRQLEEAVPGLRETFAAYDATRASGADPYSQMELLSLQDCLHRMRWGFDYILVLDFDEFAIPTAVRTLRELMELLNSKYPHSTSFSFPAYSYLPNFGIGNISMPDYAHTLRYTRRTELASSEQAKSLHSAVDTFMINWHKRISPKNKVTYVEPAEAWLHHYRGHCKGISCDPQSVADDGLRIMKPHAELLSTNIKSVMLALRL